MTSPTPPPTQHVEAAPAPLFRVSKKRNLHQRQRRQLSASPPPAVIQTGGAFSEPSNSEHAASHQPPTLRAIPRKRFASGIEFSGSGSSSSSSARIKDEPQQQQQQPSGPAGTTTIAQEPLSLTSRFMPSTGVVNRRADEERYLMAYIDSHLHEEEATATADPSPSSIPSQKQQPAEPTQPPPSSGPAASSAVTAAKPPATIGRLHEIDLGPSARRRNEKATLKASRQLNGASSISDSSSSSSDDDNDSSKKKKKKKPLPPKIRVTRTGKILPPRRPRRVPQRSASDVERDRAVEEMLRGDVGLVAVAGVPVTAAATVGDVGKNIDVREGKEGDEELVERFRREYAENAQMGGGARKQVVSAKGAPAAGPAGPKMGGSRSARAAAQAQAQTQGQSGRGRGR